MAIDLSDLRTDRNRRQYTTGRAPHKALLLLTFIKLHGSGLLDLRHIAFDDVAVLDTYRSLWGCLTYDKPGKAHYPLFHLESDGFYRFAAGTPEHRGYSPSLTQLRQKFGYAYMTEEFMELMATEEATKAAVEQLLTGGYFSAQEISRLNAQLGLLDRSLEYVKHLEESATSRQFVKEQSEAVFGRRKQERDPEFRQVVLRAYANRCAVCGLSIVSHAAGSPIEAAHILPFAEFHNDDPRNGLALCGIHHWAFDSNILGVAPTFKVKISNTINDEQPDRILSQYMNRRIGLPEHKAFWPAREALEWRYRNRFAA